MTAISALGQANVTSVPINFELSTTYAPPYDFLVVTEIFGTVDSE
jgi:hypothetical protein